LSCHRIHFLHASVSGNDVQAYKLVSGLPPFILSDVVSDTIRIQFQSKNLNGILQDSVHVFWYDESEGLPRDTLIAIPTWVIALPPNLQANVSDIQFDSVALCKRRDTVISLKNMGCDTLLITSGPGKLAPMFTGDSLQLPLYLPPDSTKKVHIH